MKELNRQNVRQLSEAFTNALKPLESTYGIKVSYKSGRFSPSSVTFKFEAAVIGQGGVVLCKERQDYEIYAESYGLKKEWLDQEFSWCGNTYKVFGLKPRCWKSPILVERVRGGKKFKMSTDMVIGAFKLKGLK